MLQTVATILFLLLGAAGIAVIAASLADDWAALRRAFGVTGGTFDPLPPRIHDTSAPHRARVVRVTAVPSWRAAA